MLTAKQIRKMAKAISDTAIASQGTLRGSDRFWSNGFVGFWEPLPDSIRQTPDAPSSERSLAVMEKIAAEATLECFPQELQGSFGNITIHLTGYNADIWLNADYLAAMIKRGALTFLLAPKQRCVVCRNLERRVGLVMALREPPGQFDWRLANRA